MENIIVKKRESGPELGQMPRGIEFYRYICVGARLCASLLHKPDSDQKGSLRFDCFTFAIIAKQKILISSH